MAQHLDHSPATLRAILIARGLRAFGDGFVSLLLPVYLLSLGYTPFDVGIIATATLLGSGTLSGPNPDQAGSMLELTVGGKNPITLPNGETRSFFADGDTLSLRAWCERDGARRIGFGECSGTIVTARS